MAEFYRELEPLLLELRELAKTLLTAFFIVLAFAVVLAVMPVGNSTLTQLFFDYIISWLPEEAEVIAVNPINPFLYYLLLSLYLSAITCAPISILIVYRYFREALTRDEAQVARRWVLPMILCFYAGVVYGLFLVAPVVLKSLVTLGEMALEVEPVYGIAEVADLVFQTSLISGLIFLIPPVVGALGRIGVIDLEDVREWRPLIYIAVFALVLLLLS